ncbi:MAG: hypothetical protein IT376_01955 [Polyangiaceae bacterium]|nr:hypothetical protein [Polyangiaceae bacterium]
MKRALRRRPPEAKSPSFSELFERRPLPAPEPARVATPAPVTPERLEQLAARFSTRARPRPTHPRRGPRPADLPRDEPHVAERALPPRRPAAPARDASRSERGPRLPDEWAWRDAARRLRVVIVGGVERAAALRTLQEAFAFRSIAWVEPGRPRVLASLCERILAGSVDLVVINKYLQHKDSQPVTDAARRARVPAVVLPHGYGIGALRAAIEREVAATPRRSG